MEGNLPCTQATYDSLVNDLKRLKSVERPTIIEAIADARAQGDLKENAEYHAAKDRQGEIEERIRYLEDRIARSEIITADSSTAKHIIFGATVSVKNLDSGVQTDYTLVSSDAVDVMVGKISCNSPIGKSLIGKNRGDKVEIETPRGITRLEILDYK
jgi:transcription elongation factor GreA